MEPMELELLQKRRTTKMPRRWRSIYPDLSQDVAALHLPTGRVEDEEENEDDLGV
jgi:hypothetical protein